jgi:hypothetical protein
VEEDISQVQVMMHDLSARAACLRINGRSLAGRLGDLLKGTGIMGKRGTNKLCVCDYDNSCARTRVCVRVCIVLLAMIMGG